MSKLLFIGCGKMGGALLRGIAAKVDQVVVVKPSSLSPDLCFPNVISHATVDQVDPSFVPDLIVIAIKPQNMASVLPLFASYQTSVYLSIAAGQTLGGLSRLLGHDQASIVRAMPNLPASIGKGISGAVANGFVSPPQKDLCAQVLAAAGQVVWLEGEDQIDAVTALSGSGPAYVFALVEAMAQAGQKLGLSPQIAACLARQTIIGSGALMAQTETSATDLRVAVTSKGGTTAAALAYLQDEANGLPALLLKAMESAARRAKELAN